MEDLQQEHSVQYSVVVPVYNAEKSLVELCERLVSFFKATSYQYEIIFVDDRSIDKSWQIIKELKLRFPFVRGVRLSRNFGQHNATCSGFKLANGNYVVTIDDDLEVSPEDIGLLIDRQSKVKSWLVYGHYKHVERPIIRQFFKVIYSLIAKVIEGKARVNGSSFRLLKADLAKKIEANSTHFVFIDEACLWYTEEIEFVEVKHLKSRRGKSNYSLFDLFRLTGEVALYSSVLPLKFVKYIGFTFASINFLIGLYYLAQKTLFGLAFPGYASIVISVLFSTGLIIFILGVLGEYLSKMFRIMNNRPTYSIEEEL